jgi:hypothetical protein
MKTNKVILIVYLIFNFFGLLFFLIKCEQIERKSGAVIPASEKILKTNNSLLGEAAISNSSHSHLIKSIVQSLSASATVNIDIIGSTRIILLCGIALSGLNSVLCACLLRTEAKNDRKT